MVEFRQILGRYDVLIWVFLSSRVTGACPVTTDLIMRVNVRTTTTTTHLCKLRDTPHLPQDHDKIKTKTKKGIKTLGFIL